jgi:hypothetical protein
LVTSPILSSFQQYTKNHHPARTEQLCNAIYDDRNTDPWGGEGFLSTILRTVKPADTSDHSTIPKISEAKDYYTSAQKELTVREQSAALVRFTTSTTKSNISKIAEILSRSLEKLRAD